MLRFERAWCGGVTERPNVPVLKTGDGVTHPRVQISPPPPYICRTFAHKTLWCHRLKKGWSPKMTQAVTYKGFTIQPALRQLVDTGQWELNVFISWTTEDEEDSRHFVKTGRYATEDEATVQCITYGQQIVDGQVPGSSVG